MKIKWHIIHNCDLDDGTFDVIGSDCHTVLANCKFLPSAKRWVISNLL